MTARDAAANRLNSLISLSSARTDTPTTLPDPVGSAAIQPVLSMAAPLASGALTVSRPQASADEGNLPGVVHAALRQDLEASPPAERAAILARAGAIKTRAQAAEYLDDVRGKVRAQRAKSAGG